MSLREDECGQTACGILANLWVLIGSVLDEAEPALEALGLSPKAFFLLAEVDQHPFPAELARVMHLPPPTATYLIKQLESKGMIERRPEPGDLRKFRLVQTEVGRQALVAGNTLLGEILGRRLNRLSKDDLTAFDRSVRCLTAPSGREAIDPA